MKIQCKTIDTSTELGILESEKLLRKGWKIGSIDLKTESIVLNIQSVDFLTMYLYKPLKNGKGKPHFWITNSNNPSSYF